MNDKIKSILWIAFAVVFAVVFIIWMAASPRPDHIEDTNGAEDYSLQQITPADVAAQEMGSRGAPSTREIRFNIAGIGITSGTEYYSRRFTGVYRLYTCTIFKGSDVYVQLANFEINGGNFAFYVLLDGEIIGEVKPDGIGYTELMIRNIEKTGTLEYVIAGESADFTFTPIGEW